MDLGLCLCVTQPVLPSFLRMQVHPLCHICMKFPFIVYVTYCRSLCMLSCDCDAEVNLQESALYFLLAVAALWTLFSSVCTLSHFHYSFAPFPIPFRKAPRLLAIFFTLTLATTLSPPPGGRCWEVRAPLMLLWGDATVGLLAVGESSSQLSGFGLWKAVRKAWPVTPSLALSHTSDPVCKSCELSLERDPSSLLRHYYCGHLWVRHHRESVWLVSSLAPDSLECVINVIY